LRTAIHEGGSSATDCVADVTDVRKKQEEGRRKKEEGRRKKKEEGRRRKKEF